MPPRQSRRAQDSDGYTSILSAIVARMRNEPFLFVIAIAILLVGLALQVGKIGSENVRLLVFVLAVLCVIALVLHTLVTMRRPTARPAKTREASRGDRGAEARRKATEEATRDGSREGGKYQVDLRSATGVAVGDHATVHQLAPPAARASRSELEQQLATLQRRLARLEAKQKVYGDGPQPVELVAELNEARREIERVRGQLSDTEGSST